VSRPLAQWGASASPDRFAPIDWLALGIFLAPVAVAIIHSIAGGF
jgi:hypothetical protein